MYKHLTELFLCRWTDSLNFCHNYERKKISNYVKKAYENISYSINYIYTFTPISLRIFYGAQGQKVLHLQIGWWGGHSHVRSQVHIPLWWPLFQVPPPLQRLTFLHLCRFLCPLFSIKKMTFSGPIPSDFGKISLQKTLILDQICPLDPRFYYKEKTCSADPTFCSTYPPIKMWATPPPTPTQLQIGDSSGASWIAEKCIFVV